MPPSNLSSPPALTSVDTATTTTATISITLYGNHHPNSPLTPPTTVAPHASPGTINDAAATQWRGGESPPLSSSTYYHSRPLIER